MNIQTIRTTASATLAAGAAATLAALLFCAGYSVRAEPGLWSLSGFALWITAPYLVVYAAGRWGRSGGAVAAYLFVSLAVTGLAAAGYSEALFGPSHSTSALVFLWVPAYQAAVAVVVFVGYWLTRALTPGSRGRLSQLLLTSLAGVATGTSLLSPHTLDAAGPRDADRGDRPRLEAREPAWKDSGAHAAKSPAGNSLTPARP